MVHSVFFVCNPLNVKPFKNSFCKRKIMHFYITTWIYHIFKTWWRIESEKQLGSRKWSLEHSLQSLIDQVLLHFSISLTKNKYWIHKWSAQAGSVLEFENDRRAVNWTMFVQSPWYWNSSWKGEEPREVSREVQSLCCCCWKHSSNVLLSFLWRSVMTDNLGWS